MLSTVDTIIVYMML